MPRPSDRRPWRRACHAGGLAGLLGGLTACGGGGGGGGSAPIVLLPATAVPAAAGPGNNTNADQTTMLAAMNAFRAASGVGAMESHAGLIQSAGRHAGYLAIEGRGLSHGESNVRNPLFVANDLFSRVLLGSSRAGVSTNGFDLIYQDIASTAATAAINNLWNTVYHRLPMMRHHTAWAGYGDQAMAREAYPSTGVPAVCSPFGGTNGYGTIDFAARSGVAVTLSYWPSNGLTGVPRWFDSDTEAPDPAPGINRVGPPIHVIYPVDEVFTSVTASLRIEGGAEVTPLRVLTQANDPLGGAAGLAGITTGEIFVMNEGALGAATTYRVSISAQTADEILPSLSWTFTTSP
jgi:hypothetical protein